MSNDGRLVEMIDVVQLDRDQEWQSLGMPVVADLATTTVMTLTGRSTDQWYRRHPQGFDTDQRRMWRSVAGGTPAPANVVRALDAALGQS